MAPRKCKVRGCILKGKRLRQFPDLIKERERCLKWITACDNPDLFNMDSTKNMNICDVHFEDFYKLRVKLSKSAVPTLHLPEPVASIPKVIPPVIAEVIEVTDAMEIVTSQIHSDGHSNRTTEAGETIVVPSTSGVSQKKKVSRKFKTSLMMQDDEDLNKTVWDPLEIFNCSSHYKYAIVILNRPLLWKNNILFQIWEKAQIKVTVDGGTYRWLNYLEKQGIDLLTGKYNEYMPNLITGDMDSCSSTILDKLQFMGSTIVKTPDQDHSDYTKALLQLDQYARNENINLKAVYVFVESSGRLDHILGNINTLYKSDKLIRDVQVIHVASNSLTWILKPGFHSISIPNILVQNNSWCGLLPIGAPVNCITTTGLKWNLNNATIKFGGLVSSSNTYDNCSEVTIDTDAPVIWTMGIKPLVENMDSHRILTFNSDSH